MEHFRSALPVQANHYLFYAASATYTYFPLYCDHNLADDTNTNAHGDQPSIINEKYRVKTDLKFAWYRNYAYTRTNHIVYLAMSLFKTMYWATKMHLGPNSFSTQIASFANSSQRHKMSEPSFSFGQLLEVKRLQNMPVGIPITHIPVVMGWSLLLRHVSGAGT